MMTLLFIGLLAALLLLINRWIRLKASGDRWRLIFAGSLLLILSPLLFVSASRGFQLLPLDGNEPELLTMLYTTSFVVNGTIVIIRGIISTASST